VETFKDPIIEELKRARKAKGFSVEKLGDALAIPAERIRKWENPKVKSSPKPEDKDKVRKWLSGTWNNIPNSNRHSMVSNKSDKYVELLEDQVQYLKADIKTILTRMEPSLVSTLKNTVYARAEIRGAIEYQVMKDAGNNEKKRAALMEQINKLIQMNVPDEDGESNSAA
jgi:transcriptional regulator with XRE-family HTH domain